ncbi:uncharacterized protein LOC116208310 isoform X2 [Punica granatum]|uniref:Uncharacterized protein LOC116208310 isoform X2 n=2 Tax=Punica granatum TaxID=22663 RepID=A0A6P8DYU0_PUNGR|nr:uncharacterized protein LOC116208310 isoform X2 [Punica granatum]
MVRAEYDPKSDLLDDEFMLKGKLYQRKDLEVTNSRGDVLKCSHYVPVHSPEGKPLPCVIYCHGNSGCRVDASEAAIILLPSNITVFTLDFSGSGLSGGEHVTLGWNEKDDLKAAVDYLRADGNVSLIGLWGRSMGAVTSLMYGAEDPSIAGMVLDSPFSVLVDLMMELVDTYKIRLPKFTVKFAIQFMRKAIQKKAKFDITELNALKVAKTCFVPVLIGHATEDDFIRPHHSDRIFEGYVGDKNIIKFEGDHNSPRPQFYFDSINIFFHNVLQPPEDEVVGTFFDSFPSFIGKTGWSGEHEPGYAHKSSVLSKGLVTSSTADAIRELRTKQTMSQTKVPFDMRSKDDQSDAEDLSVDDDSCTSSSRMINFELSNGNPYGPHVPASIEDEQYVEYELEDLAGFPSSVEEEEKMLMEAVVASLKDLEKRGPQTEDLILASGTDSFESSRVGDPETSSTTVTCAASKTESASSSTIHGQVLVSEHPSPETSVSSSRAVLEVPPSSKTKEEGSSQSNPPGNAPVQSDEAADVSGKTKATLTVVKSPTSHILEGLIRRWDLNCFRSR